MTVPSPTDEPRSTTAKTAATVTIIGQLVKAVAQFVGLVAFSHLLSPHEIGIFAMLVVFQSLGELFRDFGLSQAAIQTATLTQRQASNLFWSNTALGIVMSVALYAGAPVIAGLYHEPALRGIAPWVAISFTINALQAQFQVRMARDLRFVALTATDASSQFIGLAAGLIAAVAGAGYWSLVIQMLTIYTSLLIQRVAIAGWWPGPPGRASGMAALYRYGWHSGLAQFVNYIGFNADSYIVGTRWGASALGIYNRAFQLFTVPANQLLAPLTNVVLPFLSKRHHAGEDFYPFLLKVQIAISVVLTGMFAVGGALADPIVAIVLGPEWHDSALILSILSIGGAVQVMSYVTFWAYLASGNTRPLLHSAMVTRSLLVLCIIVGSTAGLPGVAWGFTTGLTASWFINLAWLRRCAAMPVSVFLRPGMHVLLCGAVAGGIGWLAITYLSGRASTILLLATGALGVVFVYGSLVMSNAPVRTLFRDTAGSVAARLAGSLRGESHH